jgi:hypothetical protein
VSNCLICSSFENCTQCRGGFFLYSSNPNRNGFDKCVEGCDMNSGFLYDSITGGCKLCSSAIKNCKNCLTTFLCSKCDEGYFLHSSSDSGSYDFCNKDCPKNRSMRIDPTMGAKICGKCGVDRRDILAPPTFEGFF